FNPEQSEKVTLNESKISPQQPFVVDKVTENTLLPGCNVPSPSSQAVTYSPVVEKYHPITDAIWKKGESVPYLALAKTFEAIESISSRLKIVETLANLFRSVGLLSPHDLSKCVYLSLNRLAPSYEGIELGIGESILIKALSQTTGASVERIKSECHRLGDLGEVAETFMSYSNAISSMYSMDTYFKAYSRSSVFLRLSSHFTAFLIKHAVLGPSSFIRIKNL
ncbi:unnamed protein product, partial [Protopolystoma xenopodis]